MNKSSIREKTFKLLYSLEVQKEVNEEELELVINENIFNDEKAKEEIKFDINQIQNHNGEIEKQITSNLKSEWSLARVSKINIALLKLAIYEILYKKVPYKVVINEVVELAKMYGEETSASFINGILASVIKENKLAE